MFHSAALKLTGWYLAIIMTISIIFSIALFHFSSADLHHNVNRQIGYFNNLLGPDESQNYSALRQRQLNQDLGNLRGSLILFNILVLAGGGAASYWLARRTLTPIEEALDSQSRFASDASHELRTPLAAIQTENEVALRDKSLSRPAAIKLLRSNLEEIAKLKKLSEGLLRLSNGGGGISESQTIALKPVAEAAIERYRRTARLKNIDLLSKVKNFKVIGDPEALSELISIFIDNAIKYSPGGSVVTLSSQRQYGQVLIRIADTGAGIKQTELPHIFERFYRSDSSRSRDGAGGYGLGLAIAKKITEAHRGHIEVSSAIGQGTIFTVFLPSAS